MFLRGRVAIVTAGGGPGMGRAFSLALADAGAAVAVADIDGARADSVAAEITAAGGRAIALTVDVSQREGVRAMVERTAAELGGVHILVNHAGVSPGRMLIEDMTEAVWRRALGVHLDGAFFCMQAVIPHMRRAGWGRIVCTASRGAYRTSAAGAQIGMSDYSAAKAGLIGLTRAAALELGQFGITVNALAPGFVSGSGMGGEPAVMTPEEEVERALADGQVMAPLRPARPEEVAAALLYFAGPASGQTTGQVLHINGGSYFNA